MEFRKVKMLVHGTVHLVLINHILLLFHFFAVFNASFLGFGAYSIWWVANNSIKNGSRRTHTLELQVRDIHDHNLWQRQFIVSEVGENVEFLNLVEAFDFVLCFTTNSIPFKHSDI